MPTKKKPAKDFVRVREDDRMNDSGRYASRAYAKKHPEKTTHERTKILPKAR